MSQKLVAVIDIGSLTARLKIFELGRKTAPKEIETVRRHISVGKIYGAGVISTEQINEIVECLRAFNIKCKEYKISKIICVATSALREAENRDVVLEQLRIRTGFSISVLDNSMERYYHNFAVKEAMPDFSEIIKTGTMILDLGAGSMQATVYDKSEFVFSQNTVLGSMRIHEMLSTLQTKTTHYDEVLEEFIDQDLEDYHAVEPKGITYKNLIAFSGELGYIKVLAGENFIDGCTITKEKFLEVYQYLLKTRPSDLTLNDNIPSAVAPLLLPSAQIIRNMLEYTNVDKIHMPSVSLSDGVIYSYANRTMGYEAKVDPDQDLRCAAFNIAKRYKTSKKHIEFVRDTALKIFDATSKYNGLTERDRLLLELASILHEVGKFVHAKSHNDAAYSLIKYTELIGLDSDELDTIALIVRFYPNDDAYFHPMYLALSSKKKVLVSKLMSILRLADALDASHKEKIKDIALDIQHGIFTFSCYTTQDLSFEEWSFEHRVAIFEQVYGIKPVIKIRRRV